MTPAVGSLITAAFLWASLAILCCGGSPGTSSEPRELTQEHRNAINKELKRQRLPLPQSLDLNSSGYLVATYEITRLSTSPRALAESSLLAIREAMLPFNFVRAYRVTINGPAPGSGLIRRYGSARFIEGGSVEWESGIG